MNKRILDSEIKTTWLVRPIELAHWTRQIDKSNEQEMDFRLKINALESGNLYNF